MTPSHVHGRYALYEALGRGGAASVHLGVARGDEPLAPVAVKILHDSASREGGAVTRLLDEVRLSRLMAHPNVVPVLDFVSDGEEMLAIMQYVHGEPFSRLLADARRLEQPVPVNVVAAISCDILRGLHAAHEAVGNDGVALEIVHRDATPENMLVGADGVAHITDFGVAKAEGRLQATRDGGLRGKIAYCAPEQIGGEVTRRTDIYAVGLVLWEALVGERPIQGDNEAAILTKALDPQIPKPSMRRSDVSPALDDVVMRALALDPAARFATAVEMRMALDHATPVASAEEVGAWVARMAGERLADRSASIEAMLEAERPHARGDASRSDTAREVRLDVPVASARPASKGASIGFGIFVTLAVGALVVLAWYARTRVVSEPVMAVFPPAASVLPPILTTASTASPDASAVPTSIAAIASNAAAVTASATPSGTATAGPTGTSRLRTGTRTTSAKCDPPWLIDSHGIRRYNPDCVK